MVFNNSPSDCFDALAEYRRLYTLLSMVANRQNVRNKLNFPFPSANGTFPILSGGSSLGNSTFISSSSCTGGRPERRQILPYFNNTLTVDKEWCQLTLCRACRKSRILSSAALLQRGSDQNQNHVYEDQCYETSGLPQQPKRRKAGGLVFPGGKETVILLVRTSEMC